MRRQCDGVPMIALLLALGSGPADAGTTVLQNDEFGEEISGKLGAVGGFAEGECWLSVFEADPSYYPFTLLYVDVPIFQTYTYEIGIWDVDGNNKPTAKRDAEAAYLVSSTSSMNRITLSELKLDMNATTIESGNFAIAFCHANHEAEPSIARDNDGMSSSDLNHIFASGMWLTSNFYGVTGDWIQRAHIRPL